MTRMLIAEKTASLLLLFHQPLVSGKNEHKTALLIHLISFDFLEYIYHSISNNPAATTLIHVTRSIIHMLIPRLAKATTVAKLRR